MDVNKNYMLWLQQTANHAEIQEELLQIQKDEGAIEDRFYRELSFGTGGLRGVIGAGTNRMNIYTVRKASQGLADYLKREFVNPGIAIAYDSRHNSTLFAYAAAEVFAANGIQVHIFSELMPTPMLSFAVRQLGCCAGIVVTASHNPAKYNGYKVYGEDGCQITLEAARAITEYIQQADYFHDQYIEFEQGIASGQIKYIEESLINDYYDAVLQERVWPKMRYTKLRVVYTPLNGTGNKPVRHVLQRMGIHDVYVVQAQENPDPAFTTCPFPNPEEKEALQLGIELAKDVKADVVLATDPDCDRVGAAVLYGGEYVLISGNQMGSLLFDYICKMRGKNETMPDQPVAVKTIVTSELVQSIANEYGVELRNVLTGFKFIGEVIGQLEKENQQHRYIFGMEESYGYLSGGYVRDKDAVNASMLICEMAAFYKKSNKTLVDVLFDLFQKHGVYFERLESIVYEGAAGMKLMSAIMERLRTHQPQEIAGMPVVEVADYLNGIKTKNGQHEVISLPSSDVLAFAREDGSSVLVRPSGTEPKLKIYYLLKSENLDECEAIYSAVSQDMAKLLK